MSEDVVRCQKCGRPLSDPTSVANKLGPVCYEKVHGRPPSVVIKSKKGDEDMYNVDKWLLEEEESDEHFW
jgi:hypothetical protein